MRAFLRGGELGKLTGVRTGAYQAKRAAEGWRLRRAESGGGVFMEQGFAMLDLALWLADFPEPVRVSAHMERGRGASAVEDSMLAFVECEQGQTIAIDVALVVTCAGGSLVVRRARHAWQRAAGAVQGGEGAQRHAGGRHAARRGRARERGDAVVPRGARALFRGGARGGEL